jgi:hypothetical protein
MDVLTALIAVFVGWLLGFGQQAWRDRREAQLAARLLVDELLFNKAELVNRRDNLDWTVYRPITHRIWETYGVLILRLFPFEVMHEVQMAHLSIDYADELSKMIVENRDRVRAAPPEVRQRAEEIEAGAIEKARTAVAEVEERGDRAMVLVALPAHESLKGFVRRHAKSSWQRSGSRGKSRD